MYSIVDRDTLLSRGERCKSFYRAKTHLNDDRFDGFSKGERILKEALDNQLKRIEKRCGKLEEED